MMFTKVLAVVALIVAVLPSNSEAEYLRSKGLTLFQKKVLLYPQSPTLAMEIHRVSNRRATVSVFSILTGAPIERARIFSMTYRNQVFFLGETDSKGNLRFEDGPKDVMLLSPKGGYKETVIYHPTRDIGFLTAMAGTKSSTVILNRANLYGGGW